MKNKELINELNSKLQAYIGQPCYIVGQAFRPIDEPYIEETIVAGFAYDGKYWHVINGKEEAFGIDADFTYGYTATLSKEEADEIYNELREKYERERTFP